LRVAPNVGPLHVASELRPLRGAALDVRTALGVAPALFGRATLYVAGPSRLGRTLLGVAALFGSTLDPGTVLHACGLSGFCCATLQVGAAGFRSTSPRICRSAVAVSDIGPALTVLAPYALWTFDLRTVSGATLTRFARVRERQPRRYAIAVAISRPTSGTTATSCTLDRAATL
jgi:hypothetical protein